MGEFIASVFGESGLWGEMTSWLGSSAGEGAMSSNLMSAVTAGMKGISGMAMRGQADHPHAQSTAFHYQPPASANTNQILQQLPSIMKNDINVGSGFNAMKGMKW